MSLILRYLIPLFLLLGVLTGKALPPKEPLPCLDKKFTIVVHILKDSVGETTITEALILAAIDSLNSNFSPICVSFEVCEFKIIDNFQYDDIRWDPEWDEMIVKYHEQNRINMFFVTSMDSYGACGKATLAGIANMENGGIVILKDPSCSAATSKTITHEMGHYFGLSHTFEGSGIELVDGSNCTTEGDEVCDTPGDPFVEGENVATYVDGNCRFISMKKDANGDFYDPIVGNTMSYYPNTCACGFTPEQFVKMANTYLNSNPKMW